MSEPDEHPANIDEVPSAFWSHRWGRSGVYPPLIVCMSCLVRADKAAAVEWCDLTVDRASAGSTTPHDALSAMPRAGQAAVQERSGTSGPPADLKPLASAFHTQSAWVSAEDE